MATDVSDILTAEMLQIYSCFAHLLVRAPFAQPANLWQRPPVRFQFPLRKKVTYGTLSFTMNRARSFEPLQSALNLAPMTFGRHLEAEVERVENLSTSVHRRENGNGRSGAGRIRASREAERI